MMVMEQKREESDGLNHFTYTSAKDYVESCEYATLVVPRDDITVSWAGAGVNSLELIT